MPPDGQISFDDIVIGGGHNGLACAAYLARAGRKVAVVEARAILGGFTTTEAPFSNHPEILMPMAAMDLATANLPPSIVDTLDMRSHGLELTEIDPFYSYVAPDGTSIAFWRSVEKTCAEIARLSPADAVAYRDFTADMTAMWRSLAPYLHAHPTRPGLRALANMAARAASSPKRIARAARVVMMSPRAVLDSQFRHPALRAALANFAAASAAPLDQPGSGLILSLMAMQHEWGVYRPVGGMGAFAQTLARIGAAHGVTYFTGQRVQEITIAGGRAGGVALADGTALSGANIIGALDPKTLLTRLLPSDDLPDKLRAELAGLTVFASNIAPARVDFLLQRKPDMVTDEARTQTLLPTSMLLGPGDVEGVQAYLAACAAGNLAADIPIWAACPSLLDPSLTGGSDKQVLYVFVPAVPLRLADGGSWASRRDALGALVLARIASVMPGLEALILARAVRTPDDFTASSGLAHGCAYHADMSLGQMGPWRPTPSLAGYRTPIPGLWHTGAGAHPMGTVNGIAGKLTAQTVLRGRPH